MSARQLIVLGTASQAPTRHRNHNSLAVRWDDVLILFDPGEGSQRQAILAGVSIARVSGVAITHFHGDHCLGLPGVIQRMALDSRSGRTQKPVPVFYPADGEPYFERLRSASIFYDTSNTIGHPVDGDGPVTQLGPTALLSARHLDHRVTTIGYRIDEPPQVRFNPQKLAARGLHGPAVGQLKATGQVESPTGLVRLDEVSELYPGQSLAVVMDTRPCEGAEALADGVDLLVCESTFLSEHAALADQYAHMTALDAGYLARNSGAKRLVLTHFSARYPETSRFEAEAGKVFDDVVVAADLMTVAVPKRTN